jgi:RNA polymerase sigma-70 factor (ECF subfamily)
MSPQPSRQITELLRGWSVGDQSAVGKIVELAYPAMHRIARKHLHHERPGHTIQATALVNEAYLRLVNVRHVQWKDRAHFLAVGARIMRRILVDYARSRPSAARVDLTDELVVAPELDRTSCSWMRPWQRWPSLICAKRRLLKCASLGVWWRRKSPPY